MLRPGEWLLELGWRFGPYPTGAVPVDSINSVRPARGTTRADEPDKPSGEAPHHRAEPGRFGPTGLEQLLEAVGVRYRPLDPPQRPSVHDLFGGFAGGGRSEAGQISRPVSRRRTSRRWKISC